MARPRTPLLTVDCVALDRNGRVLLIRRRNAPFKGRYALPGGFVEEGETVEAACAREFKEETGVKAGKLHLVGVYSDPRRDPRGPTASVAFATRVRHVAPHAGDDAAAAEWVRPTKGLRLAFDHAQILAEAMRRMRAKW